MDNIYKEEQQFAKVYDLKETPTAISYRRKEDFFSYDELRAITLHNVYSALSEHDSIVPCHLNAQSDMRDIISDYCDAISNGECKFNGEEPKQILDNFLADLSQELSLKHQFTDLGMHCMAQIYI